MNLILRVLDFVFLRPWRVFYEIPSPSQICTLRWWFYLLWGSSAWLFVLLLFLLFVFLPLYDALS